MPSLGQVVTINDPAWSLSGYTGSDGAVHLSIRKTTMLHSLTIDVPDEVFTSLCKIAAQQGKTPEMIAKGLLFDRLAGIGG